MKMHEVKDIHDKITDNQKIVKKLTNEITRLRAENTSFRQRIEHRESLITTYEKNLSGINSEIDTLQAQWMAIPDELKAVYKFPTQTQQ